MRPARLRVVVPALLLLLVPAPATAATPGPSFLPASVLNASGQVATDPSVAVDPAGNAIAVWKGLDGGSYRIQAATRRGGDAWSAPISISAVGQTAGSPKVAFDAAGDATAVWIRSDGTNDRTQTATLMAGATWSTPVTLSPAGVNASAPQISVDAAGDAVAGWIAGDNPPQFQAATRTGPLGSWSIAGGVSGPGTASGARVSIDSSGHAAAVWAEDGPGTIGRRIRWSEVLPNGVWKSPADLSALGGPSEAPAIATDPAGDLVAAWDRYDTGGYGLQVVSRAAGSANWDTPITLPSVDTGSASNAQVGFDASGDAFATWTRLPSSGKKRVEASTRPVGGTWSPTVALSTPTTTALTDQLAVSAGGDATVLWEATVDNAQRIQTSTRPAGGTWSAPVNLSPAGITAFSPSIALDASGNGLASWLQNDGQTAGNAVQASGFDATGPLMPGTSIPTTAIAGTAASFSTSPFDLWSIVMSTTWSFGDGTSATGVAVGHTYAAAGTYDVSVTATDAVGHPTTLYGRVTVAAPAPGSLDSSSGSSPKTGAGSTTQTTGTTRPATGGGTPAPAIATKRVATALSKQLLLFDLDLRRTGKTCPAARSVKTTIRSTFGKAKTTIALSKRSFTVTASKTKAICSVKGQLILKSAPKAGAKVTLTFTSRATKTKALGVART
ncbi:MAG: PKD domain-containing protein [Patulibacter sp.]|nr:PKD domain-containing protein [Patulibacter sp.]